MCRRTTCPDCRKPSWAGCGAHVEQVLGDVPAEDRCDCQPGSAGGGGIAGFLARVLGG
jgi:hypothetical protein